MGLVLIDFQLCTVDPLPMVNPLSMVDPIPIVDRIPLVNPPTHGGPKPIWWTPYP